MAVHAEFLKEICSIVYFNIKCANRQYFNLSDNVRIGFSQGSWLPY